MAARIVGEVVRAGHGHHLGDRDRASGDKSRWVSELERALLEDRIDLAVHSAKDVPAELADGLELVAITARADPRDAICGAPALASLPPGARVGTSSLRRHAQIRAAREDVEVVSVRGNVDTRLRKLAEGEVDALVLALAGLERLGLRPRPVARSTSSCPPPARVRWRSRRGPGRCRSVLDRVCDPDAMACVMAERIADPSA